MLNEICVIRCQGAYDRFRSRAREGDVHPWLTACLGEAPCSRCVGADSEIGLTLAGANLWAHVVGLRVSGLDDCLHLPQHWISIGIY